MISNMKVRPRMTLSDERWVQGSIATYLSDGVHMSAALNFMGTPPEVTRWIERQRFLTPNPKQGARS